MGSEVSVHYTGTLDDGSKFDSSLDRNTPFTFKLGQGVIQGWSDGVKTMRKVTHTHTFEPRIDFFILKRQRGWRGGVKHAGATFVLISFSFSVSFFFPPNNLIALQQGEKSKFVIQSHKAYGDSGSPPKIPPKATLTFEIELLVCWRGRSQGNS